MRSFAMAGKRNNPAYRWYTGLFASICVALRNKKRGQNDLFWAENGTRTRDLNLGKVALSSPQNAARLGVTNWAISRYALYRVLHSHPKIGL